MFRTRRAHERGHFDHGWLDTYHTFSFGEYHDPAYMGFHGLRVMNEDRVAPETGFGMHGHREMEIVTYVLSGELAHKDSLGNGESLRAGELQRMTAGTGIQHSEVNPSAEPVHLYQIWIQPGTRGLKPSYEQRAFDPAERQGRFRAVVTPDGRDGSLTIHQNAQIFLGSFEPGQQTEQPLAAGRSAWLQVLRGKVQAGGDTLSAGDGLAVSGESKLALAAVEPAEVMLFDLP
jgi:redox-sensitive bicupin YhaK (pirin superfamily)